MVSIVLNVMNKFGLWSFGVLVTGNHKTLDEGNDRRQTKQSQTGLPLQVVNLYLS